MCLALMISFAALVWAVVGFRRLARNGTNQSDRSQSDVLLWAWLVPCAVFLASWDPGSAFHKLFVWPAIVLLIGCYIARVRRSGHAATLLWLLPLRSRHGISAHSFILIGTPARIQY